jgi:hypothetical protein
VEFLKKFLSSGKDIHLQYTHAVKKNSLSGTLFHTCWELWKKNATISFSHGRTTFLSAQVFVSVTRTSLAVHLPGIL